MISTLLTGFDNEEGFDAGKFDIKKKFKMKVLKKLYIPYSRFNQRWINERDAFHYNEENIQS